MRVLCRIGLHRWEPWRYSAAGRYHVRYCTEATCLAFQTLTGGTSG